MPLSRFRHQVDLSSERLRLYSTRTLPSIIADTAASITAVATKPLSRQECYLWAAPASDIPSSLAPKTHRFSLRVISHLTQFLFVRALKICMLLVLCLSLSPSVSVSVCLCLAGCPPVRLSVCLCPSLSLSLSVCLALFGQNFAKTDTQLLLNIVFLIPIRS